MSSQHTPSRRELLGGATALAAASVAGKAAAQANGTDPVLTGTSILVTGTSSGFGRLGALHYARLGAKVVATMRNMDGGKRKEAQELADIASAEKLDLHLVEIDVTRQDQVDSGVAEGERIAGGALDVVINNAGIGISGPVELIDDEARTAMFETNVIGYHRVARAALPKMRARNRGLIFAVSSQLGRLIIPNIGLYSSTKYAVEAMFEGLAYELAPYGVEICIVQPGGYPTKIWENGRVTFDALLARADDERKAAYAPYVEAALNRYSGGTTDPMDVPRAIAHVIAMPAGKRPLRRPVHPNTTATDALNDAHDQVQKTVLGGGAWASAYAAVSD